MMNKKRTSERLPPRWLVNAIQSFRTTLLTIHNRIFPSNVVLYEHFQALYLLPALYVAAELNVAQLIRNGKRSVNSLAVELNVNRDALYRVMRALASKGIFREGPRQTFSLTTLARPLLDDTGSLRHMLRHHLSPQNWELIGNLLDTVKTGEDACNRIHSKNIYDYLAGYPERYRIFDKSMSDLSSMGLAPILQAYRFSGLKTLADIGGGEGFMLANVLKLQPGLKGILFDLPATMEKARKRFQEHGLLDRVDLIEGDFMQRVPEGADGYLLKNILHNWDDTTANRILSNIRQAMTDHARVIIIDMVVPENNLPSASKMIDIQMLASMPGGRERTRKEFEHLLVEASLRLTKVYRTIAPVCIIEARRNV